MRGFETRLCNLISNFFSVMGRTGIQKPAALICSIHIVPSFNLQAQYLHHSSTRFNALFRNIFVKESNHYSRFHSSAILQMPTKVYGVESKNKNDAVLKENQTLLCMKSYYPCRHLCNKVSKSGRPVKTSPSKQHQRTPKSSVKEFNFRGKINDHDLKVKITKIIGLLEKGKDVAVFLRTSSNSKVSHQNIMPANKFHQTLEESLGMLSEIHLDFSNKSISKFTLKPKKEVKPETLEEISLNDSKTSSLPEI